jgi:hypothetical protein
MLARAVLISVLLFRMVATAAAVAVGSLQGIVEDSQHRPVPGAAVVIAARHGDWRQTVITNTSGEFVSREVPIGDYTVTVSLSGFKSASAAVTILSGSSPVLHFQLEVGGVEEVVEVSASHEAEAGRSVTPTTLVSERDVQRTPGADQTNSLRAVTAFVPGAYIVHDQLHIQGGHQVSWLIDGVPVPNTNIASNVGPQIDPKDLDSLEVQRGGYDADFGDRTYGVFNVTPRTGFESSRQIDASANAGNFSQASGYFSGGGHTERAAFFGSVSANRTDLGLDPPTADVLHDHADGVGGFGSVILKADASNQFRLVTSVRQDTYEIPNTPDDQAAGIDDSERERDALVAFSWVRSVNPGTVLTVSPFYHMNSANFLGGPFDPASTTVRRRSTYVGAQVSTAASLGHHDLSVGFYGFHQGDEQSVGVTFSGDDQAPVAVTNTPSGHTEVLFVQDRFAVTPWLTLSGGLRGTLFHGGVAESDLSPRIGGWVQLPVGWIIRASYGHYYQQPPLLTASGPLLDFVTSENLGFIPLKGERDRQTQIGLTVPSHGWSIDAGAFYTHAMNFFDHNSVDDSNVFFPLTIDNAYIRGIDLAVRSPRIWRTGQAHVAYAYQIAEGEGAISGGLTDFSPPQGRFPLDHDQRNTLSVGFDAAPGRLVVGANLYYGSGFANGNGSDHLPGHAQFDGTAGFQLRPDLLLSVTALNLFDESVLIDNSETFGGTHWSRPREVYVSFHVRVHH